MIKLVSPGEIEAGMYIIAYESFEYKTPQYMFQSAESMSEPPQEFKIVNRNPWFKGIPYQVMSKAGPIISVNTMGTIPGITTPIVFFDTRLVNFLEVQEDYYDSYYLGMGIKKEFIETVKVQVRPVEIQSNSNVVNPS